MVCLLACLCCTAGLASRGGAAEEDGNGAGPSASAAQQQQQQQQQLQEQHAELTAQLEEARAQVRVGGWACARHTQCLPPHASTVQRGVDAA